ncbi:MAG: bifunctional (p)ppGpp synthetase/guanosine-3',5'-bis(diphosphate) 3'-pyrophosphohydrolase [Bacilli bacterium]|jgi:GTP pyrophosphokinase|nr:bifunctional (p)ppGpp synthetase/guanosine-3',5'-bis(diphosphate) 3'-pyrophosphohydrolase [Bacilli bacterium]
MEQITIDSILDSLRDRITLDETLKIKEAYEFALERHKGKKRLSGEDFITHPLAVAFILTNLNVDAMTIEAALLHEVINHSLTTKEEIEKCFGEDIAKIVDSISKINKLELSDHSESSALYLRKVLVGIAEDVRVLFIKLADRLHNMRTAEYLSEEKRKQKANETMNVLVPIAHRLGINSIKSELENLSLKCLKPYAYADILERLDKTQEELKDVLLEMQDSISDILIDHDIKFYIKSRVKSVYSIYNKLNNGKKWNNIYDILAMRIIVDKVSDCYTAIGLIHAKYRPIPGRFKDYIAMPKENLYQSLHTGVFGVDGHRFEIQIRTWEMDEIAEKGIASHWSYKEKGVKKVQNMMEQKLEVFRSFIETNRDLSDAEFASSMQQDFLSDFIYVFTPKGDVVELPKNATPIDFAYRIHSDIGDHVVGAIVNDNIVPLNFELSDHDIVKIKTNPNGSPSKEWLSIVKTGHARNKIKSYFSKQERESYLNKGKEILEKEIRKRKLAFETVLSAENVKKICNDLKLKDLSEIYFVIGSLRYTAGYIISLSQEEKKNVQDLLIERVIRGEQKKLQSSKSEILVAGTTDVLVNLAKCCKPVWGDSIKGYVTKGEGVSVHRTDCVNLLNKNDRFIDVLWNHAVESVYVTDIQVEVMMGKNYLLDLIAKATSKNIYIESVQTKEKENGFLYEMTIRIKNKEELESFMGALDTLPFVKEVYRK